MGGDGVFHEAINGLLAARAAAAASGAAELHDALCSLRLAHIPAGSTDAVACTLHGSRGAFTAAMHVCLGDSTALDVLRVDTAAGGTKFASCIAGGWGATHLLYAALQAGLPGLLPDNQCCRFMMAATSIALRCPPLVSPVSHPSSPAPPCSLWLPGRCHLGC